MSSATSCAAGDNKPGRWKLTGSVYVCDEHKDKAIELLRGAVNQVKSQLKAEEEPQPPVEPQPPEPPSPPPTQPEPPGTPEQQQDKCGIRKLYADATGARAQVFYMNQDNPSADTRFKNEQNADLRKESDGSWSADGSGNNNYQVRLELWSESGQKKFLNCETTVYANYMHDAGGNTGSYAYQVYRGGGHHSSNTPCDGAAYKGRIRRDRSVVITKEVRHPDYTTNRGNVRRLTKNPVGNWIGTKLVVYNAGYTTRGRRPVKIEVWCDEFGMDANGKLDPTKQNWQKMAETLDEGGWSTTHGGSCPAIELDNRGTRRPDEILNTEGGTSAGNLVAYRTDGARTKIKYFSVREILAPVVPTSPDPDEEEEEPQLPPPPVEQPPPTQPIETHELVLHRVINQARKNQGLAELAYDNDLAKIAEAHSVDLQQRNFFSHTNPNGLGPSERATKAGYRWSRFGENILWFSTSRLSSMTKQQIADKCFTMWWNSAGHKQNMLSKNYDRHGLGIWISGNKCFATQNLARK